MSLALPTECHVTPGLRLEHQLCFRLYASSRLITRLYQPLLEPLGLTYPQYIVLMILWEKAPCSMTTIGERALLNSNTLTPLIKRLEERGLVSRRRDPADERTVLISLTEQGQAMELSCQSIPRQLLEQQQHAAFDVAALKKLLDQLLGILSKAP